MPETAPNRSAREILPPIPMSTLSTPLLSDEDVVRPAGVGLTAATLSLVKTCIGTGVMALPYAFTQAGSFAVPGMLLLGVWNFYTCHQLLRARAAGHEFVALSLGTCPSRSRPCTRWRDS